MKHLFLPRATDHGVNRGIHLVASCHRSCCLAPQIVEEIVRIVGFPVPQMMKDNVELNGSWL